MPGCYQDPRCPGSNKQNLFLINGPIYYLLCRLSGYCCSERRLNIIKGQKGLTVIFQPADRKAVVARGVTLLEAARKAGVVITTRCGGKAACLMCKVSLEGQALASVRPPGDIERRKLGSLLDNGVRLACQTPVWEDVTVSVPEDPLKAAVRRKLEAARRGEEEELW